MSRKWWREERYFAPVAAQEGRRRDQGAVEARRVWRELVGQALDPGSGEFRYRALGSARPVLCAQWASAVDRD